MHTHKHNTTQHNTCLGCLVIFNRQQIPKKIHQTWKAGRNKHPPLATENLLENTNGVPRHPRGRRGRSAHPIGAPHHCSLGAAACYLRFMLTRAILMPSLFQDSNIPFEQQASVETWKSMNPDYQYVQYAHNPVQPLHPRHHLPTSSTRSPLFSLGSCKCTFLHAGSRCQHRPGRHSVNPCVLSKLTRARSISPVLSGTTFTLTWTSRRTCARSILR